MSPEVLFGVPPTGVAFLAKPKHRVGIGTEVNRPLLHFTTCPAEPGTVPNLMIEAYLRFQWESYINRLDASTLPTATKESIEVQGIIPLIVEIVNLQVRSWFDIGKSLAVNIFLGTT